MERDAVLKWQSRERHSSTPTVLAVIAGRAEAERSTQRRLASVPYSGFRAIQEIVTIQLVLRHLEISAGRIARQAR
jgi:hypothetical protein